MKKLLASVTVAGLLAAGGASLAAGATAWAADPGGSGADQPPSSGAPGQKGQRGERAQLAIQTAAATIGVAPDDLRSQIKAGKTIAQVATEHGVDPANVVNAVIAALSQQIDQAAAQGTLDANRAAQAKQKLPDFVNRFVNKTKAGKGGGHRFLKSAVKAAAKEIGISEADLKKALKDGKTIAQVAKDHDKSVDDVVNAVVKAAKSDIDQAVKDGKLDSKRADELKKKLPDQVKKFVNGERRKNRRKGSDTPATTKAT
jgi:ribosomal protein S20